MAMKRIVGCLCLTLLAVSCAKVEGPVDPASYEAELFDWRAQRLERLRGPNGYLNLAGLFWLKNGSVSIGSSVKNDIQFPASAAEQVGVLYVSDAGVQLKVAADVEVLANGVPVQSILISDDTTESPVTIEHTSLAWTVIKRDGRFALRLRDFNHPALTEFPPIEYFPIRPELRVEARLERFDSPKVLKVDTVIEGLGWQPQSPGVVVFELDGQRMQLEAYDSGDELFFVFGDRSSGRDTYPAGRFLYADLPEEGETTILDFNRAYNPPCAFNDFATCPVASPQNRLPVTIAAGEKYDPKVHASPDSSH